MAISNNPLLVRYSLIIFFIATLTDWYDGWHARKFKSVTKVGIFLDPFADKVLTTAAFLVFFIKNIMPLWMLIIIALRDIIITVLRSYDEFKGHTLKTSFIAKSKTFLQMTYIFIILILITLLTFDIDSSWKQNINLYLFNSEINYSIQLIITAITLYTGIDYINGKIFRRSNNETD